MKSELSLNSIKPKVLRNRSDLSLLEKTAIYRYNHESADKYTNWFNKLSSIDKVKICLKGLFPITETEPKLRVGYMKKVKF